ncbi:MULTISPECIES: hypothetical protein [Vibrio]|nr:MULTISPECIES: hypothetical protein [Vibrio]USD35449.1 hypothetical protein J8Z27_15815 [Vibrio sp. SCSIO 43186]USD48523.1 hypothetical protein J4N38_16205 [Vibrio sp. SCSIO 43145]USD72573.1 hypothetical protein J4N41_15825 [Vibrio sp. SCSIO 43139]
MFKSSLAFICLSLTMITPAMAGESQSGSDRRRRKWQAGPYQGHVV